MIEWVFTMIYSSVINGCDLKTRTKTDILNYIENMDLEKGNKLPSEQDFSAMLGVSRVTLRAALNELASDGVIFRRQGKGTFVNLMSVGLKASFNPVMNFSDMIRNNNYRPSVRVLERYIEIASKEIAVALQIPENSDTVVVKKVFYADEKLCAYCIDQFSRSLIRGEDMEELDQFEDSTYQFLYLKTGRQVCWDKVEIETTDNIETPELNPFLRVTGGKTKSFLCLKGVNYDKQDSPLVRTIEYINTDIIKYNMIRRRSISYYDPR